MRKKLIFLAFFAVVLALGQSQAQGAYLAAWWDGNYPTNWADDAASIAVRDALQAVGYEILDSAQLKTFMDARIADGAASVVVFCRDIAPDTVVESNTADCTLRQYLDAGGRIVFYADIPFWNQGNSGGGTTNWGQNGANGIFGFSAAPNAAPATWDVGSTVTITDDGLEWGLTETWASVRPANVDDVDVVLATDSGGNAAAWVKYFEDDEIGGFVRIRDASGMPNVEDLMRLAEYGLGGGGNPLARRPDPEDGAMISQTWGTLSWRGGYYAVSHDLYLGTNFDDVNEGTAATFIGNLPTEMQIIGFVGFPFSDGLVPGTTYYWRVDEVNDANAASPWKGPVWSFSITPRTVFSPVPSDGAKFVETEAPTLSWQAGFDAKLHHVYFGASFDEVDNATGALPQTDTTFTVAGPLEPETTYYWRVDEFDVAATHKGPVWSFTTAKEGGGIKGEYFNNENLTGAPLLTRIDDLINFYWNPGPDPPPGINEDYFSIRWTGELEAPISEPFTFITGTDDGARVYLDGKRIINDWGGGHDYTEVSSDPIDLVAGQRYALIMEGFELGGEAEWRLYWESPSMPRQVVPQAALSLLVHAHSPKPVGGTQGLNLMSDLSWGSGEFAASHDIYLGTDADAVAGATKASLEFKANQALGEEDFDPGQLEFDTTYYWRIDEVNNTNPDSPWKGNVWSFWTGDFLVVDDFEGYDDIDPPTGEPGNRIWDKWVDGYGTLNNGARIAGDLPPYTEQTIVNSGAQSMEYIFDNTVKISEATLGLTFPTDWTANGVTKLSIQFRGSSGNSAERIFVALGNAVVYHPDPAATQISEWTEWVIDLNEFAGANLGNVLSMTIGVGTRNVPGVDATGTLYFDDIRLIQ